MENWEMIEHIITCPITMEIFVDPVIASDGHTYERIAIVKWLDENNNISPITRDRVSYKLYKNYCMRGIVERYLEVNPDKRNPDYEINKDVIHDIISTSNFEKLLQYKKFDIKKLAEEKLDGKQSYFNHLFTTCTDNTVLKHVVDNCVNIDVKYDNSYYPLNFIIKNSDNEEIIKYIINKGMNLDFCDKYGWCSIHYAIKYSNYNVVKALVDSGVDLNIPNKNRCCAIHIAVFYSTYDVVKLLIDNKVDINTFTNLSSTPIHGAIKSSTESVVKLLIESGSNVDSVDNEGMLPLTYAIRYSTLHIIQMLIELSIKTKSTSYEYLCTKYLFDAFKTHNNDAVKFVLSNDEISSNINLKITDSKGLNLIHYAVKYSDIEIVKLLTSKGVDIHHYTNKMYNAIRIAIDVNKDDIIKFLIDNGVNTDYKIDDKTHLFEYACKNDKYFAVYYLIKNGLNITSAHNKQSFSKLNKEKYNLSCKIFAAKLSDKEQNSA